MSDTTAYRSAGLAVRPTSATYERHRCRGLACLLTVLAIVAGTTGTARAYTVEGAKWGPGIGLGTPGEVSFSIMPAGLNMTGDVGGHGHSPDLGVSTDFTTLITLGANQDEMNHVLTAMNNWAAATALTNLGVVADNGALFNAAPADPRALAGPFGDIRLAAVSISAPGELAHAHLPPGSTIFGAATPNVSGPGDVHFDNSFTWSDDLFDTTADADIDFQTVALHELGHSLGLLHSSDSSSVMYPAYKGGDRDLGADDIAGIQAIYGPSRPRPVVPPPSPYAAKQHKYPGFDINDPRHSGFPRGIPLPPALPGGASSHTFASIFEFDASAALVGGDPSDVLHFVSFADTGINLTFDSIAGSTQTWDAEMVQLDISGGPDPGAQLFEGVLLPANVLIRQDPDRPTLGRIELNGVNMYGFFDVFTEASLDGGLTWIDSIGSTRMETSFQFAPTPTAVWGGLVLLCGCVAVRWVRWSRA